MTRLLLTFLALTVTVICYSQTIRIDNVTQEGENIIISFTIQPRNSPDELYKISIYSSYDNYNEALPVKTGQTEDLKPQSGIKVVIDGPTNFTGYQGNLEFQVGAEITFAPLFITLNQSAAKRGKGFPVRIVGGNEAENYQLELYQGNARMGTITSNTRGTNYVWNVGEDQVVGSDFKLKVTAQRTSVTAFSSTFPIRRKIPLGLKILPIGVAGGVVPLLLGGGKPPNGNGRTELPRPPDPPN